MRWQEDGEDLHIGSQAFDGPGMASPGGMVTWRVNPRRFEAFAWTRTEEMRSRVFRVRVENEEAQREAAKRCVEKWLATHKARR